MWPLGMERQLGELNQVELRLRTLREILDQFPLDDHDGCLALRHQVERRLDGFAFRMWWLNPDDACSFPAKGLNARWQISGHFLFGFKRPDDRQLPIKPVQPRILEIAEFNPCGFEQRLKFIVQLEY